MTLNPHQLAGHVGNLDFWLAEVAHAHAVIDGYELRFRSMEEASKQYVAANGTREFLLNADDFDESYQNVTRQRRLPKLALHEARRRLTDATYHFLLRLHKSHFIDEPQLRRHLDHLRINLDPLDLRSPNQSA
ncbi:MAG: hypothetical protein C0478_05725 [Planctomyces sp.]|nr:hypothetical protein [Planctomyces sp.]